MEGAGGMGRGRSGPRASAESCLQNYRLGKTLGFGSFAKVRLAEHVLTKQKVAIKILNRLLIRQKGMEEKAIREIQMMRILMHPHIVQLYEVIETPTDICMVMEFMKYGELFDYITESGRLQEDEARHFFQQIVSGVEFCHRNMIVHRDLKPENLLLDSTWNVKIIDFGLGNVMRDGHFLKTSCGSHNYAAPEILSGKMYAGPEVDVWSCGVILYALLCGGLPFDDESLSNLENKIKHGFYILPSHLSPGARNLISRMLLVNPMKRVTVPEIRQDPWFQAHLPRYLAVPALDSNQQTKRIDNDILQAVVNVGFDKNQLIESLHSKVQNQATVVYYLMRDKLRRSEFSYGYLGADFEEEWDGVARVAHLDPQVQNSIGRPGPSSGIASGSLNLRHGLSPSGSQRRGQADRNWALGLQSKESPRRIMMEVLKTLHGLDISWKNLGSYCLKCRWVPPVAASRVRRSNSDSSVGSGSLRSPISSMLSGSLQQGVDLHASSSITTAVSGESEESQGREEHGAVSVLSGSLQQGVDLHASSSITTAVSGESEESQGREEHGAVSVLSGSLQQGVDLHASSSITTAVSGESEESQGREEHGAVSMLSGSLQQGVDQHASSSTNTAVSGESEESQGREEHGAVKFEVQLYKVSEGKYLLDLQRIEGPLLLFLDLYASFSTELRIF